MKKTLIAISTLAALGGFVLRRLQLTGSFDSAGLVARNDSVSTVLYSLCALAAALILLLSLLEPKREVPVIGGKMKLRGTAVILAALGLLGSYMPPDFSGDWLSLIVQVLAFAAACAIAVEGMFHRQGQAGSLVGGCVLPVYLAVSLVANYRLWCQDPLVVDYCFQFLFLVSAMLASYYLAGFRVGKGKRRITLFYTACVVVFAGPVLADGGVQNILHTTALLIYLAAECWPYLTRPDPPENLEEMAESKST